MSLSLPISLGKERVRPLRPYPSQLARQVQSIRRRIVPLFCGREATNARSCDLHRDIPLRKQCYYILLKVNFFTDDLNPGGSNVFA